MFQFSLAAKFKYKNTTKKEMSKNKRDQMKFSDLDILLIKLLKTKIYFEA